MLEDLGSRDAEFLAVIRNIRTRLLALAGADPKEYDCVLMQGSGTFGIESVISSVIPKDGRLLVLANGAYGRRIAAIARIHQIATDVGELAENEKLAASFTSDRMRGGAYSHVAVVHCETTTGIVNPIDEIGAVIRERGASYIVDAMSSFGAIPVNLDRAGADFLISSANKCIQGVPGFAFVLARRAALENAKGHARTLSLDLYGQWASMERDGQFRFTPPTHVLLAFRKALDELDEEGGVEGRAARYRCNHAVLTRGMSKLGFDAYLAPEDQSYIITTYRYPNDPHFRFDEFYDRLAKRGFIIYPGKLTREPCFRIGTIGDLDANDIEALLRAIRAVLGELRTVG
jgi:2-aminoethylphosphonate-pyruvate transaminase